MLNVELCVQSDSLLMINIFVDRGNLPHRSEVQFKNEGQESPHRGIVMNIS